MENELNVNELIKIETLPKVFEQLETIGKWVDNGIQKLDLDNLVVDEEHKQEIKKARTEVNNISKMLEDKRKEIKTKILEPYELFESKYNTEVKEKLNSASEKLGIAIKTIEDKQKTEKENNLRQFFENYNEDYHLEQIISFEDVGLNITISASETSLKKQIVDFFEKVANDMMAIQSGDNKEEVLLEYKHNGFDYSKAVYSVNSKLEEIKKLEEQIANKKAIEQEEQKVVQNVNTLVSAPIEQQVEEQITCQFTVTTTTEKLKKLKEYLKANDIDYK